MKARIYLGVVWDVVWVLYRDGSGVSLDMFRFSFGIRLGSVWAHFVCLYILESIGPLSDLILNHVFGSICESNDFVVLISVNIARTLTVIMAMLVLRTFLSDAMTRALEHTGLLDREVEDPLLEERLHRIRRQLTAALVIHGALQELKIDAPNTIDLLPLIEICRHFGIIGRTEAKVLMDINGDANEAKHQLHFVSKL